MTASERRELIVDMLRESNFVNITDLVNTFGVSNETARRDLDYLQDQRRVQRVYGGAVLREPSNQAVSTLSHLKNELQGIGQAAANLVNPGESIFLCNGSTTLQVAHCLRDRDNITVVTNSLAVINELVDTKVNLIVLGGVLNNAEHDIGGTMTVNHVNTFYCDKAFFGCGGLTMDLGIMDYNRNTMPIHPHVIKRSAQHILVTSSKKLGSPAFVTACSLSDVDILVTDTHIPEEYRTRLKEHGIQVIVADMSHAVDLGEDD